jgi:thiamine-phosphate pyrophosphorylase
LYVLLDSRDSPEEFVRLAEQLVQARVHIIQLRAKNLNDRDLLARARQLRQLTRGTGTLFIMNDRPDLAVLAKADGVHVGQEELSVSEARRIVGPEMLIGVSTHNIEQARQAVLEGADYIGLGPTFPSGTKTFSHFPGLDFLRQAAAEIRLPAFAIGGITRENLAQVMETGIRRVAVSSAVLNADDPTEAARWFLQALGERGNARTGGCQGP